MKCVILAGGYGTRLAEHTQVKPKPMIEIGGRPILWHIMKIYAQSGINDFIICLGHKGYMIKEYFSNYYLHQSDMTIDLSCNETFFYNNRAENWRITLLDTGEGVQTGGRLKRITHHLASDEPFLMTYGDGVADIDIAGQIAFHREHGRKATITLVHPPARFGSAVLEGDRVVRFEEKPQTSHDLINGGFFVLEPSVLNEIDGDATPWETDPLRRLVAADELRAWRHEGFWQPMDTLREMRLLEALWETGEAPWKVWP